MPILTGMALCRRGKCADDECVGTRPGACITLETTLATKRKTAGARETAPRSGRRPRRGESAQRWLLLIYRVPSEPSRNRVSVWRELKRLGALFLQSCVCIVPDRPACRAGIDAAIEKIEAAKGTYFLFPIAGVDAAQTAKLLAAFRSLAAREYDEIIEECTTRFVTEIEFERGRENFTYEEAEEIREDFEKIERWLARVSERDWFDTGGHRAVEREIARCEKLLEAFEEEVYRRAGNDPGAHD